MDIFFYLNKKCNWKCDYCNQGTNIPPDLSDDVLLSKISFCLEQMKGETNDIYLSGGEPGLWSDYFFDEFDKLIKEFCINGRIMIFTNGKIFEKKIFEEKKYDWHFIWHVVPRINKDVVIEKRRNGNITPLIVIGRDDIYSLIPFAENNSHLGTLILNKLENSSINKLSESTRFSMDDYYNLYINAIKASRYLEICVFNIRNLKTFYNYKIANRMDAVCSKCIENASRSLYIDLIYDKVYQCCEYCESIPLTVEAFEKVKSKKAFSFKDCNKCSNYVHAYNCRNLQLS